MRRVLKNGWRTLWQVATLPPPASYAIPIQGDERRDGDPLPDAELALAGAWAVHAHEEIHRYLRQFQTLFQIMLVAGAAGLTAVAQNKELLPPLLIAAPYVLGVGVAQWASAVVEVQVFAAVIDDIEQRLRNSTGSWLLLQETVITRMASARSGATNLLRLSFFLVSAAVGVGTGFDHFENGWLEVAHVTGVTLLAVAVFQQLRAVNTARTRTRAEIDALRAGAGPSAARAASAP